MAGELSGRVVDSLTGEPIAGARIQAGRAALETDIAGLFTTPASLSGILAFVIEAEGYFARETQLRVGALGFVEIDLLPREGKFDLDFFDHVYRALGEDGSRRWESEPSFEVLDRLLQCVELSTTGYCDVLRATDAPVPESFVSMVRRVVFEDARRYSGGYLRPADVRTSGATPGSRIAREDAWVRDTVRFALIELPNDYSWTSMWHDERSGNLYSALVMINARHERLRGIYSHELAHSLGYNHPLGGWSVPLPSIMRYGHGEGPEPSDLLHGSILYRRPSGSRTPDRDPDEFVMNALRTSPSAGARLVEKIVH